MRAAAAVFQAVLWIWFFGCIVTYRIKGRPLVEGEGVKSAEFVMLLLFSAGVACFWLFPKVGPWILMGILAFWFIVQFFCHWYYTLFGASPQKLKGYNECFHGTYRIIPESDTRLIPDLYHIVLHVLIAINIVFCALNA